MAMFGKKIEFQHQSCCGFLGITRQMRPFVNLYVKVTDECNAHCRFCCNAGCTKSSSFNLPKLYQCIEEINRCGIRLNRICLTGGEPSLCYDRTCEIIKHVEDDPYCFATQLQLNTNGLSENSHQLMKMKRLDVISISLHHYDKERLQDIYGVKIAGEIACYPGIDKRKVNVSCNLIKGYIDSYEEVKKYLDFVASKGIRTIGFVSLMKVNDYCRENFIDYSGIEFESVPNLLLTRERHHESHCRCRNYVYQSENERMSEVYMRQNMNPEYCASSLLYDGEYLRQGFNNDNIIY